MKTPSPPAPPNLSTLFPDLQAAVPAIKVVTPYRSTFRRPLVWHVARVEPPGDSDSTSDEPLAAGTWKMAA